MRVAVGDVNNDGADDVVVAQGAGGSNSVAIFTNKGTSANPVFNVGLSLAVTPTPDQLIANAFANVAGYTAGANVAIGNFDITNGIPTAALPAYNGVIAVAMAGNGQQVQFFSEPSGFNPGHTSGVTPQFSTTPVFGFQAFAAPNSVVGGINIAAGNLDPGNSYLANPTADPPLAADELAMGLGVGSYAALKVLRPTYSGTSWTGFNPSEMLGNNSLLNFFFVFGNAAGNFIGGIDVAIMPSGFYDLNNAGRILTSPGPAPLGHGGVNVFAPSQPNGPGTSVGGFQLTSQAGFIDLTNTGTIGVGVGNTVGMVVPSDNLFTNLFFVGTETLASNYFGLTAANPNPILNGIAYSLNFSGGVFLSK